MNKNFMALYRNIAGVGQQDEPLSDRERLLRAYNRGPGPSSQPVMPPTVVQPVTRPAGGPPFLPAATGTANIATVTAQGGVCTAMSPNQAAGAVGGGGTNYTPWLLAGGAAVGIWALTRKKGRVGKRKKKSLLVPALVAGGLAAWYFLGSGGTDVPPPASTPAGSGAAPSATDAARAYITSYPATNSANQQLLASAAARMTDVDAQAFAALLQYIRQQPANWDGKLPADKQTTFNRIMSQYGIPGL